MIAEETRVERAAESGARALERLRGRLAQRAGIVDVRGRGLLLAIECDVPERAARACARALERGVIALVSGDDGRAISITPPLPIEAEILDLGLDVLVETLA